jgi:hypothetical protein
MESRLGAASRIRPGRGIAARGRGFAGGESHRRRAWGAARIPEHPSDGLIESHTRRHRLPSETVRVVPSGTTLLCRRDGADPLAGSFPAAVVREVRLGP